MISSGEDAVLLLKRLFDERLPILVWFVSADKSVDVKVSGFVNGLARDMIIFSDGDPDPSSLPSNRLCIDPLSIVEARYEELKDVAGLSAEKKAELEAKYGGASIVFKLSSGGRLSVFELGSV